MQALQNFHRALLMDPNNDITKSNIEGIVRYMGKDPAVFADRVTLAEKALEVGDTVTAAGEYQAALKIKKDPIVRARLESLRTKIKSSN